MTPENYQAAMNAPIQQNSDGQQIEMYEGNWALICEWCKNLSALFGVFCAALIVGYSLLKTYA